MKYTIFGRKNPYKSGVYLGKSHKTYIIREDTLLLDSSRHFSSFCAYCDGTVFLCPNQHDWERIAMESDIVIPVTEDYDPELF